MFLTSLELVGQEFLYLLMFREETFCLSASVPGAGTQMGTLGLCWWVGGVSPTLLPCRKEDGLKEASLNTQESKEWCWAATVCPASAEIISQTKLVGKTAEEQGRDWECPLSSLQGGSPVTLG